MRSDSCSLEPARGLSSSRRLSSLFQGSTAYPIPERGLQLTGQ